jgi:hypothetical protein
MPVSTSQCRSLPPDHPRRLAGDVVDHAGDARDFVDDAPRAAVATPEPSCAVIPVCNVAQPEGVVTSPAVSNYVGTGEGDREWARLESLPGRGRLRLTAVNPVTGGAVARGRLKAPPKCGELNVIATLHDPEGGTVIGRQSVGQAQFGGFIDLEFRIPPERCETKLSFGLSPSSTAAKCDRHLKSCTPLARLSSEHWP